MTQSHYIGSRGLGEFFLSLVYRTIRGTAIEETNQNHEHLTEAAVLLALT